MKRMRRQSRGRRDNADGRRVELLEEIARALTNHPDLRVSKADSFPLVVEGRFLLESSRGPFDQYAIRIEIPADFPLSAPLITETSGRIPIDIDRHASSGLCLEVWPTWLAKNPDATFKSMLEGPLRNFLLSQTVFEQTGQWPFGEHEHGDTGTIDAISELLGVDPPDFDQCVQLSLALHYWPKGHTICRCGSRKKFRDCHRDKLSALKEQLQRDVLERLLRNLAEILERRRLR